MKKNVGGDGGGERKSLRNRRRRGLDGDGPLPSPRVPPPPTVATATVTSGALHRLQTVSAASASSPVAEAGSVVVAVDGRDSTATATAVTDDWLFADWLDGGSGGGGGGGAVATGTYNHFGIIRIYDHR